MRHVSFLLVCFSIAYGVLGKQSVLEGALKDAEFVVKKERKLLLPEIPRSFQSAPTLPFETVPSSSLAYTMLDFRPEFEALSFKTQILRAKQGELVKRYGNSLQVGHGNFYTPFLEGNFSSKYHSEYAYGLQVRHLSAGREAYTEETHNLVRLHGKWFTKTLCLGGETVYNGDKYPLCDPKYNLTAETPSKALHQITVRNTVANYVHGALNYEIGGVFHYLSDAYRACESKWEFNGRGDYTLHDALKLKAFTDLYLTEYTDTVAKHLNLWRLKPMLSWTSSSWDIQGGVNLICQNDAAYAPYTLNAYPILEAKYILRKWLHLYSGIGGDMQYNSLQCFLQENPLLAPRADLRLTNQRFELRGGAKGDIVARLSWHAGFAVGNYQNFHCLVNSDIDSSRFEIKYDPSARILNTFLELAHTSQGEALSTRLRGDFFNYTLQELYKPWHRPRYQLDLLSTYRLYDKLEFRCSLRWIGGIEAWDSIQKIPVAMKDVFDVGLSIDYWWGSRLSIFLNCQNLLARKNARYWQCPDRGFRCITGLTYAW